MPERPTTYDLAVIGAGPGGYVSAIRAAQLGAQVCLIEQDTVGGTCLNRGCIPTKAMVASVQAYQIAKRAREFGVVANDVAPDFAAMMARSGATVERLVKGVHYLLDKQKVVQVKGRATLTGPHSIQVQAGEGCQEIGAQQIIVATGSKPIMLPSFQYDGEKVVTSDEALRLSRLPERVVIIGGGVIGCEFASIFAGLGARVAVVEALPTILPMVERDVSRQLASYLRRQGITLLTGRKVERVAKEDGMQVHVEGSEPLPCDLVLVSIGRRPNTAGLGLEKVGVELNQRSEVIVDERMATSAPGVYAVGDVTDSPWKLAHVASRQGIVAAHNALGGHETMQYHAVPAAVFTSPEVASVGLTSEEAAETGLAVKTARFPFAASGKAMADGETAGFVKVLAEESTGHVVGVHIIGSQAGTLIAEGALAIQHGLSIGDITRTIHVHPTLSEALMEAAEGVGGLAIHV